MDQDNKIPIPKKIEPKVAGGTQDKVVQTYAEDMAKVIEDSKDGLIKKIIHEEVQHEIEKRKLSPESKRNKFFMFTGSLLILLGLATLFYFILTQETSTLEIEKQFAPLIFIDESIFFEVKGFTKDKIVQTVLNEINGTKVQNGGVEGIYLSSNKRIVGLREFIILIKSNFLTDALPDDTLFINDNFLMGVVNKQTRNFFILLKMRSTDDIFDAMRAWEKKMFFDLHGFFGVAIKPETKDLLTKSFEDGIVQNKNARILYDGDNKIIMMYVLANDNSIIITNTEDAGKEIMLRLAVSQIKK